jgi:hypothetical protein
LILVFCTQCSVNRKRKSGTEAVSISTEGESILQSVVKQNITKSNFFIEKAEFRIISNAGEKSGIGTIKFVLPDKYLVSIKSKAGIEIARIYLMEDSVMMNDRLNKKLYYGSASDLKTKFGLTAAIVPLIFGDYINDQAVDERTIECKDGLLSFDALVKDIKIKYNIDCKYGKCIMTSPANDPNSNGLRIEYSDFFRSGKINVPGKIRISEKKNNTIIEIRILKIVIPWEGSIEFIPGKQYEKIHLL